MPFVCKVHDHLLGLTWLACPQFRQREVNAQQAYCDGYRWYARYCGWAPGQLKDECEKGVWFTAAASASVILAPETSANGQEQWHQVLDLMGSEYAKLSQELKYTPKIFRTDGEDPPSDGETS